MELQPAFILHTRPYQESSLLIQAFSRDTGKLDLIAKGVRRPKSNLRAILQPFQPLLLSGRGRSSLWTLTHAEARYWLPEFKRDYLASAFYLNELLLHLLPLQEPEPALFDRYEQTLGDFAQQAALQPTLRIFEKHLLQQLGYGLNLSHEANSQIPLQAQQRYRYQMEAGAIPHHHPMSGGVPIQGASLLALAQEQLNDPTILQELKLLMRTLLDQYLGHRPLQSRELLQWPTPSR